MHTKCIEQAAAKDCDLGSLAYHILPPVNILPAFLDRSQSQQRRHTATQRSPCYQQAVAAQQGNSSGNLLQAIPLAQSSKYRPLLVLINPKSGGRQGERIFRKFQYLLNPRQVYDLFKGGPEPG